MNRKYWLKCLGLQKKYPSCDAVLLTCISSHAISTRVDKKKLRILQIPRGNRQKSLGCLAQLSSSRFVCKMYNFAYSNKYWTIIYFLLFVLIYLGFVKMFVSFLEIFSNRKRFSIFAKVFRILCWAFFYFDKYRLRALQFITELVSVSVKHDVHVNVTLWISLFVHTVLAYCT